VAASAFDAQVSFRESQRRHQDAVYTLRQLQMGTPNASQIRESVHALLARAMNSPDASYRSYLDKITRENCQALAKLHNSSTPAQRSKAVSTLKDYETDARSLMLPRR
jgi:hypothetical protein